MRRRVFSALLVAALCVGMLPTNVLAAEEAEVLDDQMTEEVDSQMIEDSDLPESDDAVIVLGGSLDNADVTESEDEADVEPFEDPEPEEEASELFEEEEKDDVTYTAEDDSVSVKVTAPEGALPDDAKLKVKRFASDSDEYKEAARAIYLDEDDKNMAALDISFMADGEEVEPTEPVKVSIDVSAILPDNADSSTIEVQHLVENDVNDEVEPVVVANDSAATEGTIDEDKAVAEFEVNSFSTFTVTWGENNGTLNGTTITVHAYNINGTSIDEELEDEYIVNNDEGNIYIDDLVSYLQQNSAYVHTYTYRYATIYYETYNATNNGYDSTILGSADNSVVSLNARGGDDIGYNATYVDGTSTMFPNPYIINIRLYFSIPTVTITSAVDNGDGTVTLTSEPSNFVAEDLSGATYDWVLSDDSEAEIKDNENGTATLTWSGDAKVGDKETIELTMIVTSVDDEGKTVTETASTTYELTYGTVGVNITVTQSDGTPQANAYVALVDESGNTVATGQTGADGTVTLNAIPGKYTVGVTYVEVITPNASTARYTGELSITVEEDGNAADENGEPPAVVLGNAITSGPNGGTGSDTNGSITGGIGPYYYEHIDVKVAVAELEETNVEFSDLDKVYVYDKYGNLIYYTDDLIQNQETTDYNCHFAVYDADGTLVDTHSLVVSSEDTIVIVYEVYEDGEFKTYTETFGPDTVYSAGEYYQYESVNAWQLCNSMYGTSLTEDGWEAAVEAGTVNEYFEEALGSRYDPNGIDIGGLSLIQVADMLCDTRTTAGQAGLDIVIDVGLMSVMYQEYDLQIAKSLQGIPDSINTYDFVPGTYTFTLQELSAVADDDSGAEDIWNIANAVGNPASASTDEHNWTTEDDGTWSGLADFTDFLSYEAEEGTNYYYYILAEEDTTIAQAEVQYYGIKVAITFSSETGTVEIVASYCALEETETEGVYSRSSGWTQLEAHTGTNEDGSTFTYYSIPFANIYNVIEISGEKIWDDANDQDGIRPESIYIYLLADGERISDGHGYSDVAIIPDENGNWTFRFVDLPKCNADGTEIEYSIEEVSVAGYETIVSDLTEVIDPTTGEGTGEYTVTITNIHVPETIDISGEKKWDDADNQDGKRPESVTVNLLADGEPALDENGEAITATLSDENDWAFSFKELPKYKEGEEIQYNITEDDVDDYSTEITITQDEETGDYIVIVTNSYTPEQTSVSVIKVWDDADDQDGIRPESITVTLLADEEDTGKTLTLNESNNWQGSFEELDAYTPVGQKIEYTIEEINVEGYETVVTPEEGTTGFVITNTHEPETVDVEGSKTWGDNDNQDGKRPASITIRLWGDGAIVETQTISPDEDGNWSWSFTDLPKYNNGMEIVYNVTEDIVPDYSTTYSEVGYDVTNTHTPDQTSLTVLKVWDDNNDEDGARPEGITVTLVKNGEPTEQTLTLNEENNWQGSFTELDVYTDGEENIYTVQEEDVENYEARIVGNATIGYVIMNTHTPETIDIAGEKIWDDNDDEAHVRPDYITIRLLADGEEVYVYHLTAEENWAWNFTGLAKYKDGKEIEYTIVEDPLDDYLTDITVDEETGEYKITNTLINPQISKEIAEDDYERKEEDGTQMHEGEDTDEDGFGTWDDADNNQEVTYHLKLTELEGVKNLTVHDYLEDGLDFEPETVEIELHDGAIETPLTEGTDYTLTQGACSDPDCAMDGCTFEVKFEDSVFENVSSEAYIMVIYKALTDTHEDEYEDYDDEILNHSYMTFGANVLSIRRSDVVTTATDLFGFGVYKYADEFGEEVALAGAEFILAREDGVYAVFEPETDEETGEVYYMVNSWVEDKDAATTLTTGEDGMIRIDGLDDDTYTLIETSAPVGYEIIDEAITVVIDEDGNVTVDGDTGSKEAVIGHDVNVENTLILTEVEGTKTWDDNDNQDGMRPESITIHLLADGEEVDSVTVTEEDDWSWSFTDLRMYQDGVEIVYTIIEDAVDEYSAEYDDEYNVTNTHTPGQTSVSVTKAWDDDGDRDGIRPESVTVQLYADEEPVEDATLTLSEENNWTGSFTGLDIYRDQGERIAYTVEEVDVPDEYACTVEEIGESSYAYVVTNTHEPETTEIAGSKTWDDEDDKDGKRPEQITINLLADDVIVDSMTVTEADGWQWVFTDQPKYADGEEIVYAISENAVDEYTATYDGYNVTNQHTPEEEIIGSPVPIGNPTSGTGSPKTGDTNNIALWLTLLIAAMACAVVGFRMRKRS